MHKTVKKNTITFEDLLEKGKEYERGKRYASAIPLYVVNHDDGELHTIRPDNIKVSIAGDNSICLYIEYPYVISGQICTSIPENERSWGFNDAYIESLEVYIYTNKEHARQMAIKKARDKINKLTQRLFELANNT